MNRRLSLLRSLLILYAVWNHPSLDYVLSSVYYGLIIFLSILEFLSIIPIKIDNPNSNHFHYFRAVSNESCVLGVVLMPLLASNVSVTCHINYLAFSSVSLILYLMLVFSNKSINLKLTKHYGYDHNYILFVCLLFIILFENILFAFCPLLNYKFKIVRSLYWLISLYVYERIWSHLIYTFEQTFTLSDSIIISCMIYSVWENGAFITLSAIYHLNSNVKYSIDWCLINLFNEERDIFILYHNYMSNYQMIGIIIISYALIMVAFVIPNRSKNSSISMDVCLSLISVIFVCLWIDIILRSKNDNINIFNIVYDVLFENNHYLILLYWIIMLIIGFIITPLPDIKQIDRKSVMITRKYFHGWALVLFIPILFYDNEFLSLSLCVALLVFIIVESIRTYNIFNISSFIELYCRPFLDERDSGALILTHIWLLIGCSLPLWIANIKFRYHENYSQLPNEKMLLFNMYCACGIIVLGVGDAMAATIGSKYGKINWPSTNKTIEGSIAGVISTIAIFIIFFQIKSFNQHFYLLCNLCLIIVLTFTLEAITKQIDNLYLPLFCCVLMDIHFDMT